MAERKSFVATVRVNTTDLCYTDKEFNYDVADVEEFGWEMIAYGCMYRLIKNETPYSLIDCTTDVYVRFRLPRVNESQDSMVSILNIESVAPNGMVIKRMVELDADKLAFSLPKGVFWGRKADRQYSQEI